MKKGKKVLSLLLAMMLLLALISGCGTPAASTASTASTTSGTGFTEPPYEVIIQTITFGSKMDDISFGRRSNQRDHTARDQLHSQVAGSRHSDL